MPPQVVIEIDTKSESKDNDLVINIKTQKLLDFGVARVIWIFTDTQKVMVAVPGQDWLIKDWHKDLEIMDGHIFNIATYLEKEGIRLEKQA